jgi:hypothetical protein
MKKYVLLAIFIYTHHGLVPQSRQHSPSKPILQASNSIIHPSRTSCVLPLHIHSPYRITSPDRSLPQHITSTASPLHTDNIHPLSTLFHSSSRSLPTTPTAHVCIPPMPWRSKYELPFQLTTPISTPLPPKQPFRRSVHTSSTTLILPKPQLTARRARGAHDAGRTNEGGENALRRGYG